MSTSATSPYAVGTHDAPETTRAPALKGPALKAKSPPPQPILDALQALQDAADTAAVSLAQSQSDAATVTAAQATAATSLAQAASDSAAVAQKLADLDAVIQTTYGAVLLQAKKMTTLPTQRQVVPQSRR